VLLQSWWMETSCTRQPLWFSVTINLSPLRAIYKIHFSFIQLLQYIYIYIPL
jgi:hypothetical protein